MKSDAQLLREYATQKSELAFGEIVRRYADLIYSAAWRQVGSSDMAAETAQSVFIDLARKASSLAGRMTENGSLAGWLYRATRYAALNLLRDERRRLVRERTIMQDLDAHAGSSADWNSLAPLLDEAIAALSEQDREALLLRFFKNMDFRAVGAALGVSDDTAQKRVARSLEKLRAVLQRRGVTTTAGALSTVLAASAVQTAPAGLAAQWISASLAQASAKAGATLSLLKFMSMTKIQMGFGAVLVSALAVTVGLQQKSAHALQVKNLALSRQIAALASDNAALSNSLQQIKPTEALPDAQLRELLRLRNEVGLLRQRTNLIGKLEQENGRLQARGEPTRDEQVPMTDFKQRETAFANAAKQLGIALRVYAMDNDGQFPTNLVLMSNELGPRTNFEGNIPFNSFELINVGKAGDKWPGALGAREANPRQSPSGGWNRIYIHCDGSIQTATSPNGDFSSWEASADQIPAPPP